MSLDDEGAFGHEAEDVVPTDADVADVDADTDADVADVDADTDVDADAGATDEVL